MTRAAVIASVEAAADGFKEAAPGHVFQLYLPLWAPVEGRLEPQNTAKGEALQRSTKIPEKVGQLGASVAARQRALAQDCDAYVRVGRSTSPFSTGLGNEHPVENGFAFLAPYGMPYLAGSGIKGVLRRAAECLLEDGDTRFSAAAVNGLFGVQEVKEPGDARRGALAFWDCHPQMPGRALTVEVMTPHYSHYYGTGKSDDGHATPHDAGQPNPVPFLAVPTGAEFWFVVTCDERRLPEGLGDGRWKALLDAAFDFAFDWLGFGAKTSVGYGAMRHDEAVERRHREAQEQQQAEQARQAARAEMTAAMLSIADFTEQMQTRAAQLVGGRRDNPNGKYQELAANLARRAREAADWTREERASAAAAIEEWLPRVVNVDMRDVRRKLRLRELRGEAD